MSDNNSANMTNFVEFLRKNGLPFRLSKLSENEGQRIKELVKDAGMEYITNELHNILATGVPGESIGIGDATRAVAVRHLIDEKLILHALLYIAKGRVSDAVRLNARILASDLIDDMYGSEDGLSVEDAVMLLVKEGIAGLKDVKSRLLESFDEEVVLEKLWELFEEGFINLESGRLVLNSLSPLYNNYIARLIGVPSDEAAEPKYNAWDFEDDIDSEDDLDLDDDFFTFDFEESCE